MRGGSVDCREGPPVPIPNTEVKLAGAEDTWLETARENKFSPTLNETTRNSGGFLLPVSIFGDSLCRFQIFLKKRKLGVAIFKSLWYYNEAVERDGKNE